MDVRIASLTGLVIAFLASFATVRPALAAEVGLNDALDEFREDGHRVLYSTDLVRPYMRVDTPARSERNIDWLRKALAEYDLVLSEVSDGWYIVARDTATRPDVDNAVFISGTVVDQETGVPIPGAIVNLNGGEYRTRTLATGDFLVAGLPPGSYTATVTAPGFAAHKEKDIEVVHFASLNVKLKRMPFTLEDVTLSTSRYSLLRDLITRQRFSQHRLVARSVGRARSRVERPHSIGRRLRRSRPPRCDPSRKGCRSTGDSRRSSSRSWKSLRSHRRVFFRGNGPTFRRYAWP